LFLGSFHGSLVGGGPARSGGGLGSNDSGLRLTSSFIGGGGIDVDQSPVAHRSSGGGTDSRLVRKLRCGLRLYHFRSRGVLAFSRVAELGYHTVQFPTRLGGIGETYDRVISEDRLSQEQSGG
jgi:hypothetical protein